MTAAVAFDLDGVLLDSEGTWAEARREVAVSHGGRWPDGVERAMMGMSSPEWAGYLRDELGVQLGPDSIVDAVVQRVLTTYRQRLPLLPGAEAAVRRLSTRWPLGLASSSNRPVIDAALDAAGLRELFTVTVSSEEVPRGKPAPDVYLAVATALGVPPTACAAVEDSTNGIRAGVAAGMVVVAVPNRDFPPEPDALSLAARRIETLDELTPDLIEAAASGQPL
ncbi:MAG TPA: HAD family phosphatase [Acidimicrobiales bacterium]|nr:HAD family phosphatase [Acidimicrobiales bacterium]